MAFFSQKEHKLKRSHSTERTKPHPAGPITSTPSLPIRTRTSSRHTTIYGSHPTEVHVQGLDPKPPTPKLNTATSRHSLRRVPVPSLSIQDVDKLPYDRTRTSPIPSSRSTSISGKSSIADISGAYNVATSKMKPDHLRSSDNSRIPTPPHSSPHHWESSSASSRNLGDPSDPEKTVSHISDLTILVSSPKQVSTPMASPRSASQKPQRAVLRRKSNAKQPKPQPSNQGLTHKRSKTNVGISAVAATLQRAVSSPHQPPHLVSTPPSLDAAHRVRRSISDERKPRSSGNVSPTRSSRMLTPAGAVVAAYKEQEKRKKEFVLTNVHGLSRSDSCDEDGGVYYTVFGSRTVVDVGAPEDESWSRKDLSNAVPDKAKRLSRKPSLGTFTRLSRKPSAKTKNEANGVMSESECGHERASRNEEVRRSSFHGRRSTSVPPGKHRNKKPPGILLDNSDGGPAWDSPRDPSTPTKSSGWSVDDPSPSAGGKIWKLMKRISTSGLKDRYYAQEVAPPVPALPEGLLATPSPNPKSKSRSAPHSPEDSKLPISRYIRGRSSFGDAPFTNRRRTSQSVPNPALSHRPPILNSGKGPSHRQSSTNTRSSSPLSSDKAPPKYWQKSRSSSVSTFEEIPPLPARIMTSKHILSPSELFRLEREQAMAEFPSPPSTVDSHSPAPSPSNQHRKTMVVFRKSSLQGPHTQASGEDSEADGTSTSEFASLPTPPRHHYKPSPHAVYHQSNDSSPTVGSVSTSPTIPMFSTQDVVNRFNAAKGTGVAMSRSMSSPPTSQSAGISSDEFGVATPVKPPPRPLRSEKRKPLFAMRASLDRDRSGRGGHHNRGQLPLSASASHPRERTFGLSGQDVDEDGKSYGTFGRTQPKGLVELVKMSQDSSREGLKLSSSGHSKSPLKFREAGSGEGGEKDRKVLTEQEKADRWDDLLEKSDRAGGTIHIGNAKLPSDSLRFSDYSTLTILAL
jgi:hypothetical protein